MFNSKNMTRKGLASATLLTAASLIGCDNLKEANIEKELTSGGVAEAIGEVELNSARPLATTVVCDQDSFDINGYNFRINVGNDFTEVLDPSKLSKLEHMNISASVVLNLLKDKGLIETINYAVKNDELFVSINESMENTATFSVNLKGLEPVNVSMKVLNEVLQNVLQANGLETKPSESDMEMIAEYKQYMKLANKVSTTSLKNEDGQFNEAYMKAFNKWNEFGSSLQTNPATSPHFMLMLMEHSFNTRFVANIGDGFYNMTMQELNGTIGTTKMSGVDISENQIRDELIINFHIALNSNNGASQSVKSVSQNGY